MPQAYELLTDSKLNTDATKGTTVYKCRRTDYGCASDDTRLTGIEHISVTLNKDGDYPFFTHPLNKLKKL